jgi:hypothetical protein
MSTKEERIRKYKERQEEQGAKESGVGIKAYRGRLSLIQPFTERLGAIEEKVAAVKTLEEAKALHEEYLEIRNELLRSPDAYSHFVMQIGETETLFSLLLHGGTPGKQFPANWQKGWDAIWGKKR